MELVHAKIPGPHMPNPICCTGAWVFVSQHPGAGPTPAPAPAATPGDTHPPNPATECFQALSHALHPPYIAFGRFARLPTRSPQPRRAGARRSSPEQPTLPRGSRRLGSLLPQNSGFERQGRPAARCTSKAEAVGRGARCPRCPGGAEARLPGAQPDPNSPELPGHFGGRAANAAVQQQPLGDARSSAAPSLPQCGPGTSRRCPSPKGDGGAAPGRNASAPHPSPLPDTPTPQCLLLLSSPESLRHIHGYHRN